MADPSLRPNPVTTARLEDQVFISGIGQSDVGKSLPGSELSLTLDAIAAAVADAGLELDDIDGLATYPGGGYGPPGLAGPGTAAVQEALRLPLNWYQGSAEGAAQLSGFIAGCMAVGTGLARHVVVYRTVKEGSARLAARTAAPVEVADTPPGLRWTMPYGVFGPQHTLAMYATRHMHQFGTTREQVGAIAVTERSNAGRNPKAIMTAPITLDDYLAARWIVEPFCLLDCDIPCDGSTAIVLSPPEHASATPKPPVRIEGIGSALLGRPSFEFLEDYTQMNAWNAARHMWRRTTATPDDINFGQLYDGFSWLTLFWLEALGFCKPGEGGPFVEGGARISLNGTLPINTGGGQLSSGRLHGWGHLYEACLQLRGEAGARQLPAHEIGVVSMGGGSLAGCLLLRR